MANYCKWFGHKWVYRDCSHAIKLNGEKFFYSMIRKCKRCDEHQYKYADWVDEEFVLPGDKEFLNSGFKS